MWVVGRRDVDKQLISVSTPVIPTLAPDELKSVMCKVCAGTFDLSSTGVFPEHFFNFRALRKPCKASGKRYAHVNAPRGKEAPKVVEQQAQPPEALGPYTASSNPHELRTQSPNRNHRDTVVPA